MACRPADRPQDQVDIPAFLAPEILDRIRARVRPEDRQRSLRAYSLAVTGAMRLYGRPACDLRIDSSPGGKPCFAPAARLLFNCSHSGDWVVCALAAAGEGIEAVGIDIEQIDAQPDYAVARFFHSGERAWLEAAAQAGRAEAFYRLWTLKESYIKALGRGLSEPLDSFQVRFGTGGHPWVSTEGAAGCIPVLLAVPDALPGHAAALCILTGGGDAARDARLAVQWHFWR